MSTGELEGDEQRIRVKDKPPQLCRKLFAERINIEASIERKMLQFCGFLVMICTLFVCLATYDPLSQISDVHSNLEKHFQLEMAEAVHSHQDIMKFIAVFISASYEMAPVLIDANTKDSIDFARCNDEAVQDICQMKYWHLNKASKRNLAYILDDQLGLENSRPSQMDCPSPPSNCIDRDSQLQRAKSNGIKGRIQGLLPEDPLVLDSRLPFQYASLVPLTPVVWQARSPRKPCSGFGDRYNRDVLGAGLCKENTPCQHSSVTSYAGTKPAPTTGRLQTYYLTYSEDAFYCVDRSEFTDVFLDRSWSPWASYQDVTQGRRARSVELDGKTVFYKFVSNVAYLQRPIPRSISIHPQFCSANFSEDASCTNTECDTNSESHAMWTEPTNSFLYTGVCSLRGEWTNQFLKKGEDERESSFLTMETTELTVAVLVVTPQTAAYRDVVTMVGVTFNFEQGGTIRPRVSILSTSETWNWWYYLVLGTVFAGLIYIVIRAFHLKMLLRLRSKDRDHDYKKDLRMTTCDMVLALMSIAAVMCLAVIDATPPHIIPDLFDAFEENKQSEYFEVYRSIVTFREQFQIFKQCVFVLSCMLFVRLCFYLSIHPRSGLFVNTVLGILNDMLHMGITLLLLQCFLAFIAWWMFGASRHDDYGSIEDSWYTGLQMFVGEFPSLDTEGDPFYVVWLVIYVTVIAVIFMNFILASVVGAFESIKKRIAETSVDMTVFHDTMMVAIYSLSRRRTGFPPIRELRHYLLNDGKGFLAEVDCAPAVTAKELYDGVVDLENNEKQAFKSVEHAQKYINFYVRRVKKHGVYRLAELRQDKTFYDNESWTSPEPVNEAAIATSAVLEDAVLNEHVDIAVQANLRNGTSEADLRDKHSEEHIEMFQRAFEEHSEMLERASTEQIKMLERASEEHIKMLKTAEMRAERAEERAQRAEGRAGQAEDRANGAEVRAQRAEQRVEKAELRATGAEERAEKAEELLEKVFVESNHMFRSFAAGMGEPNFPVDLNSEANTSIIVEGPGVRAQGYADTTRTTSLRQAAGKAESSSKGLTSAQKFDRTLSKDPELQKKYKEHRSCTYCS